MALRRLRISAALASFFLGAALPFFAYADFDVTIPAAPDVAAVCEQEKQLAASHAHPDVSNVVDNTKTTLVKDSCVAAILNPALAHTSPANPQSYICVGKRARISITPAGLLSDTNVPDPTVPAGTCATTACNAGINCFAADQPTSLLGEATKFINSLQSFFGISPGGGPSTPTTVGIRG